MSIFFSWGHKNVHILKACSYSEGGSFCFMSWCINFFCAVGALCMFSYF